MITMNQIKEAFKSTKDLGNGFFRKGNKEIHAAWGQSYWHFVGYYVDTNEVAGSFKSLESAKAWLGA